MEKYLFIFVSRIRLHFCLFEKFYRQFEISRVRMEVDIPVHRILVNKLARENADLLENKKDQSDGSSVYSNIIRRRSIMSNRRRSTAIARRNSKFLDFTPAAPKPSAPEPDDIDPATGQPIGREFITKCQPWRVPVGTHTSSLIKRFQIAPTICEN